MAGDLGLPGALGAQAFGDSLDRAWQERFQAAQVVAALRQKQQALDQGEAIKQAQLQSLADYRRSLVQDRTAAGTAKDQAQAEKEYGLIPLNGLVPASEAQNFVKRGIPTSGFRPVPITAPSPPESLASGDQSDQPMPGTVANSPQPAGRMFQRAPNPVEQQQQQSEAGIQQVLGDPNTPAPIRSYLQLRRILPKGENPPVQLFEPNMGQNTGEIRDTSSGLVRIGKDNAVTPIQGPNGKPVQSYHPPVQPVVVQTGTGPQLVDRGAGTAKPITGQGGAPVGPLPTAQERNRTALAKTVQQQVPDVQTEIDQMERLGMLGPLSGRTVSDLLGGTIGSTGDPQKDELLGELRLDMAALASGFAAMHGRGGANAGMARDLEAKLYQAKMSHAEITGALKGIGKWVGSYAKPLAPSGKPTAEDLIKKYGGQP